MQPPPGPTTVEFTVHGQPVKLALPDPTDHIQKQIWESQGFYEADLLEDMRPRLAAGDLCVDVGAHMGNHTIYLARICGARVLAFEPQPDVFEILQRNIELNGLQEQVTAVNIALGASAGHADLHRTLAHNTGTARLLLQDAGPVTVSTLDEQVGDQRVALIKIDVEGFEVQVLEGAARTIERDHPIIYAEAMDVAARTRLDALLRPRGYVALDQFSSTPVVAFVHQPSDVERFSALARVLVRNYSEKAAAQATAQSNAAMNMLERMMGNLEARTSVLERRIADIQALVDPQRHQLERLADKLGALASAVSRHEQVQTARFYELLNLGAHAEAHARGSARGVDYKPLNEAAAQLAAWRPRRRSWTVPKGTEAEAFLQGYASRLSAQPGDTIDFHLSSDRPGTFAVIRVFRIGHGRAGGQVVHTSAPVCVPATGVWQRGGPSIDPGRWACVHRLPIEEDWKPGLYLARFETMDGKANQHPFWVTSKTPTTRLVMLSSVLTHLARNRWGRSRAGRLAARLPASVVSRVRIPAMDRLRSTRLYAPYDGSRGGRMRLHEVPFLRWAEANQLAIDLITDVELHQQPDLLARWEQVVIAGDAAYATREIVDGLRRFGDQGGSIAALGAAPFEHLVTLDLDGGHLTVTGEPVGAATDGRLWSIAQRGEAKQAVAHRFRPQLLTGELADVGLGDVPVVDGLCGDRISGTALADDDPALLARTTVHGGGQAARCDTILTRTPAGGRLFVAGTDRWTWGLDDFVARPGVDISTPIRAITARVVGLQNDLDEWEPLVSVIMTSYESRDCVGAAVDSILAQSYAKLELIVVDDASTDGTFELLLERAAADPRVRPFRSSRNHGTYWCKNYGISRARGELITFQDSDDVSDATRLAVQVEALRRNPQAIASTVDYIRVNEKGELLLNRGLPQRRAFPSLCYRAERVMAQIGFFDSVRSAADQEHFHRLCMAFPDADIIDTRKPLYRALVREGSLTQSGDSFVDLSTANGPSRLAHLSPDRRAYVLAYEKWHERIARGEADPWMPFPLPQRPFPVPERLDIDAARRRADLDHGARPAGVPAGLQLVAEDGPVAAPAVTPPVVLAAIRADEAPPPPPPIANPRPERASVPAAPASAAPVPIPAAVPIGGRSLGTADLFAESVYRITVEFEGTNRKLRGRVVGVSLLTGKALFSIAIDPQRRSVAATVFTDAQTDTVDVRLILESSNGHGPPPARMQVQRRGERPPRSDLGLHDRSITAAMATYPGRRQVLPSVIDTLLPQVDRLFVYLNNYQEVPAFIGRHPLREKIVFVLEPASQRRAAAKFYWLDQIRGYHLICDDDILYPEDYAARMVEFLDRHDRQVIAGVHGVVLTPTVEDARGSRRFVCKFDEALPSDVRVHVLGTGTVALHSDVLPGMDLSLLHAYPIANDEILGVSAKDAGVPMLCVSRGDDWLRAHPDVKFGIFDERTGGPEHERATALLASANPWPDLGSL